MKNLLLLLLTLVLTVSLLTACAESNLNTRATTTAPIHLQPTTTGTAENPPTSLSATEILLRSTMTVTKKGAYNLECTYRVDQSASEPGDVVTVSVQVKNVGKKMPYIGALTDQFASAHLLWDEEYNGYSIPSIETPVTDDATEREFAHLETAAFVYQFEIPQDAPAGSYTLKICAFGITVKFDDSTAQVGRYIPFLCDLPEEAQKRLAGIYYGREDYPYYSSRAPVYGEFDDVYVMIPRVSFGWQEYRSSVYIEDLRFVYAAGIEMHVYTKDGIYPLQDAYKMGIISMEQLLQLYENYYWIHPELIPDS